MMNAIGGTSIHYWAQSWRLKPWDFKTRTEVIKRYGASAIPKGSTLEDWPIGYDDLEPFYDLIEHEVGVSGKAGNIQGNLDPAGNVYEAPRQREYPMPPLRGTEFTDHMMDSRAASSAGSRFAARRHQLRGISGPAGLRVSRLLQPRRMPHQRQEFDRRHHHPGGAENQKPDHLRSRASHAHRRGRERPRDRRHLHSRRQRIFSAGASGSARLLHLRKFAPAAALQIESLSERSLEQSRPGGQALFRPLAGRR